MNATYLINLPTMNVFLFLIGLSISLNSFSQGSSYFDFETDDYYADTIYLDTISSLTNSWQIGSPQKTILSNALSEPNVIITDTINPYPINDSSNFIYQHIAWLGASYGQLAALHGYYMVDSDSTDFGDIEISLDMGNNWTSLISDSAINTYISWYLQTPELFGNSNGWQYFHVELAYFAFANNVQAGDTILLKFSFTSDSIQTNRGGLMYDNLAFDEIVEGIEELDQTKRHLVKIVNILGIESKVEPNTLLFYLYSDGTSKKVVKIE